MKIMRIILDLFIFWVIFFSYMEMKITLKIRVIDLVALLYHLFSIFLTF